MAAATTLDVKKKEFNRAVRGYAMHEVDAFLDEVVEEMERLHKEVGRLQNKASDRAADETIARTMLTAQRTADRTMEAAEIRAQEVLADAQLRASTTVESAQLRAREVTEMAEARAREVTEQLARRQRELEHSIDALRAFEREYRGLLRQCVQAQMDALDAAAPTGPVAPPLPNGITDISQGLERLDGS